MKVFSWLRHTKPWQKRHFEKHPKQTFEHTTPRLPRFHKSYVPMDHAKTLWSFRPEASEFAALFGQALWLNFIRGPTPNTRLQKGSMGFPFLLRDSLVHRFKPAGNISVRRCVRGGYIHAIGQGTKDGSRSPNPAPTHVSVPASRERACRNPSPEPTRHNITLNPKPQNPILIIKAPILNTST